MIFRGNVPRKLGAVAAAVERERKQKISLYLIDELAASIVPPGLFHFALAGIPGTTLRCLRQASCVPGQVRSPLGGFRRRITARLRHRFKRKQGNKGEKWGLD
jgi:hypothetical protein